MSSDSFSRSKMLLHAFRRNCRTATQKMTRNTAEALQGKERETRESTCCKCLCVCVQGLRWMQKEYSTSIAKSEERIIKESDKLALTKAKAEGRGAGEQKKESKGVEKKGYYESVWKMSAEREKCGGTITAATRTNYRNLVLFHKQMKNNREWKQYYVNGGESNTAIDPVHREKERVQSRDKKERQIRMNGCVGNPTWVIIDTCDTHRSIVWQFAML